MLYEIAKQSALRVKREKEKRNTNYSLLNYNQELQE